MENALAKFQIESNGSVVLEFQDGRRLTVSTDQLAGLLGPKDLARVKRGLTLRSNYLRSLPKWTQLVVMGAMTLAICAGGLKVVSQLGPAPAPPAAAPSAATQPSAATNPTPTAPSNSVTAAPSPATSAPPTVVPPTVNPAPLPTVHLPVNDPIQPLVQPLLTPLPQVLNTLPLPVHLPVHLNL